MFERRNPAVGEHENRPAPESPRILFLTPPVEDYLSISLLHGFRSLLGDNVIDVPRYEPAYASFPNDKRSGVYGRGFSVFFDLPDVAIDRSDIEARLGAKEFDLVIFSDIWRQFRLFAQLQPFLDLRNTIVVDGSDSPSVYPHAGLWWRDPRSWLLPRATKGFLYFKREWTEESQFNLWHRFVPRSARHRLTPYRGLRGVSFSFLENKIVTAPPLKTKDFPIHIVDSEVAAFVPGSATSYAFATEAAYYGDLQSSRFGITTKRSGWDCLRHYEIAANGAVPCFRDLDTKPITCAPHGLVPGENCLSYRNAPELLKVVDSIDTTTYNTLQKGAREWIRGRTTSRVAREVIKSWSIWANTSHEV
jgi:hypothetical protein